MCLFGRILSSEASQGPQGHVQQATRFALCFLLIFLHSGSFHISCKEKLLRPQNQRNSSHYCPGITPELSSITGQSTMGIFAFFPPSFSTHFSVTLQLLNPTGNWQQRFSHQTSSNSPQTSQNQINKSV